LVIQESGAIPAEQEHSAGLEALSRAGRYEAQRNLVDTVTVQVAGSDRGA
jgi:hypothetical protein